MNKQIIKSHQKELMGKENVVGVGRGTKGDKECVVVLVERKMPLSTLSKYDVVPKKIKGIQTDIIEVGHIKALNTERVRPVRGGFSIGHVAITAGTAGCVVYDNETGQERILSNNHVLANSNEGVVGDNILQPGPIDGGAGGADVVGTLTKFQRIVFDNEIPVDPPSDCPFAKTITRTFNWVCQAIGSRTRYQITRPKPKMKSNLLDGALMAKATGIVLDPNIIDIGIPSIISSTAFVGMSVNKSGRTTKLTTGKVITVDATVQVDYGQGRVGTFEDQIITTPMSEGGDSGSLIVFDTSDNSNNPVGLLFAGSQSVTIANEIGHVMDALNVHF